MDAMLAVEKISCDCSYAAGVMVQDRHEMQEANSRQLMPCHKTFTIRSICSPR